ncbi:MAG: hypothetical protein ACRBN8_39835 [Nannocystales bacterium]
MRGMERAWAFGVLMLGLGGAGCGGTNEPTSAEGSATGEATTGSDRGSSGAAVTSRGTGSDSGPEPSSGTTGLDDEASSETGAEADPGEWQLPESHRVGPILDMYPLYPRPDAEVPSSAYHRVAHPQLQYRVPIGVQGGEWPFQYALLSGPEGASFVASELTRRLDPPTGMLVHERTPGYGVLEWTPTAGTHTFEVRVTDQSGDSADFSWEVVTDESAFVFVDAADGDDDATGSFEDPLRTFAGGLWGNDDGDESFAGRVAVFREGEYEIFAAEPNTSPVLDWERKPSAFVGFPGESTVFDVSEGHFRSGGRGSHDDLFVSGIDFVGSRSDLGNNRIFNITARSSRMTFWELSFDQSSVGTIGTDNPGCIALMSDGLWHENLFVSDSTLGSEGGMQLVVTFDTNFALFERNTADRVDLAGSNGSMFLRAKDDTSNVTIRDNRFVGSVIDRAISVSNQNTVDSPPENQEVCWNTVVLDGGDAGISVNQSSSSPDGVNTHVYRNSVVSERRAIRFNGAVDPVPTLLQGNAYFGEEDGVFGSNFVPGDVRDVELGRDDFSNDAALVGEARATHGGVRGAEVMAPADGG